MHNYAIVRGKRGGGELLFAVRIIREFRKVKEFREWVVLCESALP